MSSGTEFENVVAEAVALGGRLRAARQQRRLTQVALAKLAGISRRSVDAVERGMLATGLGAYLKVLHALELGSDVRALASDAVVTGKKRVRESAEG